MVDSLMTDINNKHIQALKELQLIFGNLYKIKEDLLESLISTQFESGGWPVLYPSDRKSHIWTTAQNLQAILLCHKIPKYYTEAIHMLLSTKEESGGWKRDASMIKTDNFNVYCTGDAVMALILARQFDQVIEPLDVLQKKARNIDFGWGVVLEDKTSKVRTTCWALQTLLRAYDNPYLRQCVQPNDVEATIRWLMNVRSGDGGWGFEAYSQTSNLSATAWAAFTLLVCLDHGFDVPTDVIIKAVDRIKLNHINGKWTGVPETYTVYSGNESVGIHRAAGLGTNLVLRVLLKTAKHFLLPVEDETTFLAIKYIFNSVNKYENYPGRWVLPSSLGEEKPTLWDSAYTSMALQELEQHLVSDISKTLLSRIESQVDSEIRTLNNRIMEYHENQLITNHVLDDLKKLNPEIVFKTVKRNIPKTELVQLILYKIITTVLEINATINTELIYNILLELAKSTSTFKIIDIAELAQSIVATQDSLLGHLERLKDLKLIETFDKGWRLCETVYQGHMVKAYSCLKVVEQDFTADLKQLGSLVKTILSGDPTAKEDPLIICRERLRREKFRIRPETTIGKLEFDMIAEKRNFLRSEVAVVKKFRNGVYPKDIEQTKLDIDQIKEIENIKHVYLCSCRFTNDCRKYIESVNRKELNFILIEGDFDL